MSQIFCNIWKVTTVPIASQSNRGVVLNAGIWIENMSFFGDWESNIPQSMKKLFKHHFLHHEFSYLEEHEFCRAKKNVGTIFTFKYLEGECIISDLSDLVTGNLSPYFLLHWNTDKEQIWMTRRLPVQLTVRP